MTLRRNWDIIGDSHLLSLDSIHRTYPALWFRRLTGRSAFSFPIVLSFSIQLCNALRQRISAGRFSVENHGTGTEVPVPDFPGVTVSNFPAPCQGGCRRTTATPPLCKRKVVGSAPCRGGSAPYRGGSAPYRGGSAPYRGGSAQHIVPLIRGRRRAWLALSQRSQRTGSLLSG